MTLDRIKEIAVEQGLRAEGLTILEPAHDNLDKIWLHSIRYQPDEKRVIGIKFTVPDKDFIKMPPEVLDYNFEQILIKLFKQTKDRVDGKETSKGKWFDYTPTLEPGD